MAGPNKQSCEIPLVPLRFQLTKNPVYADPAHVASAVVILYCKHYDFQNTCEDSACDSFSCFTVDIPGSTLTFAGLLCMSVWSGPSVTEATFGDDAVSCPPCSSTCVVGSSSSASVICHINIVTI